MVTFDSAVDGTAASVWRGDHRISAAPALDLSGVSNLVVVSAHPDDETLGAGGLIASCAADGIDVTVIVVTDGAASHPWSTTHDRAEVADIRSGEIRAAVSALAPDAGLVELEFPDGETREQRASIAAELERVITSLPTEGTLLVAPWSGDGHRDHRVVGELCRELADERGLALLEYPIWMWHWSSPDDETVPWRRLRSQHLQLNARRVKARAVAAFESQVSPLSSEKGDGAMLSPHFLANFEQDSELFFAAESETLPARYFDDLYERHDDPWGFATRWYERRKRALTMAALESERYGSVLEIGCSLGLLTLELADRAEKLLAVDISQAAVDRARERLANHPNVSVELRDVASSYPAERFDLVVLSEVGYYLDRTGLDLLLSKLTASLSPGATVVLCHWRHPVEDYPLSGDKVHSAMGMHSELTRIVRHEEKDFLLDVYSLDARSVAERTGLT